METRNMTYKEIVVFGFALFAMFFGAGNLIFPPSLGVVFGNKWWIGILGFSISGVALPLLAIVATAKAGGKMEDAGNKVFPGFGKIFSTVLIVFIGVFFMIPRTGATTYEMAIRPLLPDFNPVLSSIIYFTVSLFFCINASKVIDRVGKILTPVLLVCLLWMITAGIFLPLGIPQATELANAEILSSGFISGYQTADALAGFLFAGIVVAGLIDKGVKRREEQIKLTAKAGFIAAAGLAAIYMGLCYLGASVSSIYAPDTEKTVLLTGIIGALLGSKGQIVLGFAVGFACLSTAVGGTSVAASVFESASNGKIKYRTGVVAVSVFSAIVSVRGVESLIMLAMPVLLILYPVAMALILAWLLYEYLPNDGYFSGAVLLAFIVSVVDALGMLGIRLGALTTLVSSIPMAKYGFSWLLPSIVGGLGSSYLYKINGRGKVAVESE